jgi:hypothetical protein
MKEQEENIEKLLKKHKLIRKDETLNDFFLLSYNEIERKLKGLFSAYKNYLKPIPNKQNDRLPAYIFLLVVFSESFFTFQEESVNYEIKTKLKHIITKINNDIINELSPYILAFFKWDFNRRIWKNYNNGYKTQYIKKIIKEIREELTGNKEIILKKYIELFLEFILEHIDKFINEFHNFKSTELLVNKDDTYKLRHDLSEFLETNKLSEYIDNELELSFLDILKPIAKNWLEGLIYTKKRFDYLLYSFVNAQSEYKFLLEKQLEFSENIQNLPLNDIKLSLASKNIELFIKRINTFFSSVPNVLTKNTNESFYHIYIHLLLKLIGCDINSEIQTNVGRIDAVLKINELIYIIEFKISSADKAMKQIKERKYYQQFLAQNKCVMLLGIAFDKKTKLIKEEFELQTIK